jgi:hypothetical protein
MSRTVDEFSLDVGYINTLKSVDVTAYDAQGNIIRVVPVDAYGIVRVTIQEAGIASFSVKSVSAEPAGWAIDNVTFPLP